MKIKQFSSEMVTSDVSIDWKHVKEIRMMNGRFKVTRDMKYAILRLVPHGVYKLS